MKKLKSSTDHFTGREREALHDIRKQLAREIQPLMVLYLGSLATTTLRRNLSSIDNHTTDFRMSCELLVVLPDGALLLKSRSALHALERRLAAHADVRIIALTPENLAEKLASGRNTPINLNSQAIVLYEKDNTLQEIARQLTDTNVSTTKAPPVTSVL